MDEEITDEAAHKVGLPDAATLARYAKEHKRALDRRKSFFNTEGYKPTDISKLPEAGKAYFEKQGKLNQSSSQADSIIGRIRQKYYQTTRRQIIDFELAKLVVDEIYLLDVGRKNKPAIFTDEQTYILENVIKYFIGDKSSIYALHKGLFVYGKFGVGKDNLFRVMHELCIHALISDMTFANVPTKSFVASYVDYYKNPGKKIDPLLKYNRGHLLLKDLGEEPQEVQVYNNVINPIDLLLSERNDAFDQSGFRTHVSSNLGLDENDEMALENDLERLYGGRILDRFYDQFEAIHLPGDSKRG